MQLRLEFGYGRRPVLKARCALLDLPTAAVQLFAMPGG